MKLEFLAEVFLSAMRRERLKLNPAAVDPYVIKSLQHYPSEHQGALMNALSQVAAVAGPEGDKQFQDYVARRQQNAP